MTTETTRARRLPSRRALLDLAVLSTLTVLGLLGFATSFDSLGYLFAGLGGLVVGTAAALVAAYLRLDVVLTALVVIAAYFLFGSAFALPQHALFGVLPTLDSLADLAVGAVFGWADIVTLSTPVQAPDYISVLPYVASWVVGVVSATLAARWFVASPRTAPRSFLAILGPIVIYVATVLMGTEVPYLAAIRGISFAIIAVVWMSWRVSTSANLHASSRGAQLRRRLLGVAVVAAVAIAVGGTVGFVAAPAEESRFVLRDKIEPPFDPLLYPSPLSGFRKYTKDLAEDVLFTVSGLKEGERIRLATMDSYDGAVWNVTGAEQLSGGSGSFRLVGATTPPTSLLTPGEPSTIEVTIDTYKDVWLPGVGYPAAIEFDPEIPSTSLRYNSGTGITAVIGGVSSGMHYTLAAETQEVPSDEELKTVPVATVSMQPLVNVPDIVAAKATELAGDSATPIERLRAIETTLSTLGFLSHGTASEQIASSAGHGADRMKLLLERNQWIGDEEQFASVFALMARELGYPARVVVGFAPEAGSGAVEVHGDDVTAWVEVAFEDVGWIPFYPTPDETDIPQDQTPQPKSEPQPQVRQPPRSENTQDDLVSAVELEKPEDEKDESFVIPGWVWVALTIVAIPLALYFVPVLIVALVKRRRRAGRLKAKSPDEQVAGAWDELVDTYAELGYSASRKATREEIAWGFEQQFRDELAARERERFDAADRAQAKATREAAKAERKASGAREVPASRLGAALEETVVRARETRTWRPGVENDAALLPAIPGLREFADRADEAVFSGRAIEADEVQEVWAEADEAGLAARKSVSWFRRQLSKFRVRPRRNVAEYLAESISTAIPTSSRGQR